MVTVFTCLLACTLRLADYFWQNNFTWSWHLGFRVNICVSILAFYISRLGLSSPEIRIGDLFLNIQAYRNISPSFFFASSIELSWSLLASIWFCLFLFVADSICPVFYLFIYGNEFLIANILIQMNDEAIINIPNTWSKRESLNERFCYPCDHSREVNVWWFNKAVPDKVRSAMECLAKLS